MELRNTLLTQRHITLGARMMPFAGFNMPVSYSTITEEHLTVRQSCGVFDVSHMGEFIVRGVEATQFLLHVLSNDVSKLSPGEAQYSCIPNDQGGIVDDLLVYRLFQDQCSEGEQAYMLVVNASNIQKDWDWLSSQNTYQAKMIDISDRTALLAVQGPDAAQVLQTMTDVDLDQLGYYTFTKGTVLGKDNVLISATGYTGAGGFELYLDQDHVTVLWDALMDRRVKPMGLGARDTLRLEMGYCLYGNDIDDDTSPLEAGLSWITKLKRDHAFPSKEIFIRQKQEGVNRKLIAFKLDGKRVPRHGYQINDHGDNQIGAVTSGTMSPSLGYPIGMGYVLKKYAVLGETIQIKMGKKYYPAEIVKAPFYKS